MISEILHLINKSNNIALFFNYDGTLCPVQPKPELAVLDPLRKKMLQNLSHFYNTVIVTGRSLNDIRDLVGLSNVGYVSNHGLEIYINDKHWIHPYAVEHKHLVMDILNVIELKTKKIPGVFVENKHYTGSIHYGLVSQDHYLDLFDIINQFTVPYLNYLKVTKGKKVVEVRPKIDCDKGTGIKQCLSFMDISKRVTSVFIGDDETDEEAFKAICEPDITICVGEKKFTNARYKIENVDSVWQIIRHLLNLKNDSPLSEYMETNTDTNLQERN